MSAGARVTRTLDLPAEPQAVRQARRWVADELTTRGREDLLDAARLGISELVTNAILHAAPPISVRIGGTTQHPRVEVHDGSSEVPAPRELTDDARLLATFGRGISIVATYATSWGAVTSGRGKVVWFEPAPESWTPNGDEPVTGEITDLTDPDGRRGGDAGDATVERVPVRLLRMPVRVFAHYRLWYEELRRELRLLALSHGEEYPLARKLSALTVQVELERRQARGLESLAAANAAGEDVVDLAYEVPATAPATMARLDRVLDEADAFCRKHDLLTGAAGPQLVALRTWYLGEFVRQGRGEEPVPWSGGLAVEEGPYPHR
jgi:anti-sigma regulatory factor (Ser/Thr protein kinase)